MDEKKIEKDTPTYLRKDYLYPVIGDEIKDLSEVIENGVLYEIKCLKCEMSIRSQGKNIKETYQRLKDTGCIGCGNKELVLKRVDMSNRSQN